MLERMMMIEPATHLVARLAGLILVGSALTGCTTLTLPVEASMQNSTERFSGTATGHMDGAGELELTSTRGEKCTGRFVYINGRQGSGTITCAGGRNGPFEFVSTGSRGTGQGRISGEPMTIVFGR
jgi:hypothetical protein